MLVEVGVAIGALLGVISSLVMLANVSSSSGRRKHCYLFLMPLGFLLAATTIIWLPSCYSYPVLDWTSNGLTIQLVTKYNPYGWRTYRTISENERHNIVFSEYASREEWQLRKQLVKLVKLEQEIRSDENRDSRRDELSKRLINAQEKVKAQLIKFDIERDKREFAKISAKVDDAAPQILAEKSE